MGEKATVVDFKFLLDFINFLMLSTLFFLITIDRHFHYYYFSSVGIPWQVSAFNFLYFISPEGKILLIAPHYKHPILKEDRTRTVLGEPLHSWSYSTVVHPVPL